jgi:alanine dehydrogenase
MTSVPVFTGRHVEQAVSPNRAVEAVREAFIAHARGEWTMPPKVYVTNYPAGDFRAMPALGAGHALLKWVTSFPGNPLQGLPTVTGLVLVSDAENGAVIGAGVNGRAAARTFLARGRPVSVWDVNEGRAKHVAQELGADLAPSLEEALGADLVVTVTPGHEVLIGEGSLRAGQHVSLMGADGPGKAEMAGTELARATLFCDDWEQASHGGELAHAVEAGLVTEQDVTALGAVLTGAAQGRSDDAQITAFDSTGLAIQDLAIALAAIEAAGEIPDLPRLEL